MHGLDWGDIRYFLGVVRAGSVTRAAHQLGVNQTTVSRRIAALEARLNKRLFERSGNHWLITPVGEQLVASAEIMDDQANSIQRHVMADSEELSGRLRVTVADVCTQKLVLPTMQLFTQTYPDVDVELIATRDLLDLAAREADVALRSTEQPPSDVVGKCIGRLGYAIYGGADIFDHVRHDAHSGDIPCITWPGDGHGRPAWIEKSFPETRRVYRTSELGLMLEMARQGVGMAQMPCVLVEPDPLLHRIPAPYVEPGWGLWVLSHVDLRTTARVRIFRDLLIKDLMKRKHEIEGRAA